jgi:ribulose-5-phosphate 4-epimerase/fuculose-1-phosphate aldolase
MHLSVYRARPDVRSVVHTHSPFATTFAVLGRPVSAVHYVLAYAGEAVPVAAYQTYGSDSPGRSCVDALGARQAVLLASHGVVAVAATPAAALNVASAVEYCAELVARGMHRPAGDPGRRGDGSGSREVRQLRAAAGSRRRGPLTRKVIERGPRAGRPCHLAFLSRRSCAAGRPPVPG